MGKKEEDFVMSRDPWFRPVAVQMGPDGAMYIADFYNSIIGHYEVPLDHPKRDKIRGRIWRVTYKGHTGEKTDWSQATIEQLFSALNADNLRIHMTACDQLVDRFGTASVQPFKTMLHKETITEREYVHGLWALQRLGQLDNEMSRTALVNPDPVIRVHALRTILEQPYSPTVLYSLILDALHDNNAYVKRATVEALAKFPILKTVEALIEFRKAIPEEDTHLIYTTRLILRNLLRQDFLMNQAASKQWKDEDAVILSTVLIGVESSSSAQLLFAYLKQQAKYTNEVPREFMHIIRFIPGGEVNDVVKIAKEKAEVNPEIEYKIFKSLRDGITRRGGEETAYIQDWGKSLVVKLMNKKEVINASREQDTIEEQMFFVTEGGTYRIKSIAHRVIKIFNDTAYMPEVRLAAIRSLIKIDADRYASLAGQILNGSLNTPDLELFR